MTALRRNFDGPARRIAIAGVATVVLVALAVSLTLWRYGAAVNSDRAALAESRVQFAAEQARTALERKLSTVQAYAGDGDVTELPDLKQTGRALDAALLKLRNQGANDERERSQVDAVIASTRTLDPVFSSKVVPVAGTPRFDEGVKFYLVEQAKVADGLDRFARARATEASAGASTASSDAHSAKVLAIIVGAIAALAAIVAALYSSRLVARLL
ncbi:MAG: hypothetical protein QOK04_186, partial [Solirubrobacteraceae bacterium]|nr:hypothetical protein [Solirubrobacteraceae bacterium]